MKKATTANNHQLSAEDIEGSDLMGLDTLTSSLFIRQAPLMILEDYPPTLLRWELNGELSTPSLN